MRTISISGPRWLARARGLQHDGLSSDRHTRDRALGRGGRTPVAAKTLGGISLLVWIAVVVCGRWIGFTLH